MAHLIKLELKKFGVIRNTCFTIAVILFCILFITVSLVDSMTDPEQTKDSFESTFLVIGLLMSFSFSGLFVPFNFTPDYRRIQPGNDHHPIFLSPGPQAADRLENDHYYDLHSYFHNCRLHLLLRLYYPG